MNTVITNQQVADLARSDGLHDFKAGFGPTNERLPLFNESVPTPSTLEKYTEPEAVRLVLGENWASNLESLPSILGVPVSAKRFSLRDKVGSALAMEELGFVPGGKYAFVVDMIEHKFLTKLKSGAFDPSIQIHYLITPEVANDPAPKTNMNNDIFTRESGISIVPQVEYRTTPIVFDSPKTLVPNEPFQIQSDPHTLFFSKMNHTLNPIRNVTSTSVPAKLEVDLIISELEGKNLPVLERLQNAIKRVKAKLENAIKNIPRIISRLPFRSLDPEEKKIATSILTGWSRKRSGDWLQAISCLDIANRRFLNPLGISPPRHLDSDTKVYFVTHDQIALSYALLIGCNVIFFAYDQTRCVIFTREQTIVSPKELKEKIPADMQSEFDKLTPAITKFNGDIETKTKEIKNALESLKTLDKPKDLEQAFKGLFLKTLEYIHLDTARQNYQGLLDGITQTDNIVLQYRSYLITSTMKTFSFDSLTESDGYKLVDNWEWSVIDRKRLEKVAWSEEKLDIYGFLEDIAKLPDTVELRNMIATTCLDVAKSIKSDEHPIIKAADNDRTKERLRLSFGSLAFQTHEYLRFQEAPSMQKEHAELLLYFSNYEVKHGTNNPLDVTEIERSVKESKNPTFYAPLLHTFYVADDTLAEQEESEPERKRGGARELSPMLAMVLALDSVIGPDIENSPDLDYYGNLIATLRRAHKRRPDSLWRLLHATADDIKADIPIDEYTPYALMISSLLYSLFGETKFDKPIIDRRPYLRNVWRPNVITRTYTYEDVLETYAQFRSEVFGEEVVPKAPLIVPIVSPPGSENVTPSLTKPAPVFAPARDLSILGKRQKGDEGGTRRKLKRSKSSRRTKRAHRSGRAKESETQSSQ